MGNQSSNTPGSNTGSQDSEQRRNSQQQQPRQQNQTSQQHQQQNPKDPKDPKDKGMHDKLGRDDDAMDDDGKTQQKKPGQDQR